MLVVNPFHWLNPNGSIHDKDDTYTWVNAFTVKITTLNSGGGFAGHTDWRLPNVHELHSLVSYGALLPAIDATFNNACSGGCPATVCSCTPSGGYWASTSHQNFPASAWVVYFNDGIVNRIGKTGDYYVRAVRGGS